MVIPAAKSNRRRFLTMFAIMFIGIGVAIIADPGPDRPELFHTQLPTWVRVLLWAGCGVAVLVASFRHRWHVVGFALLVVPPVERCVSYAGGVAIELLDKAGVNLPHSGLLIPNLTGLIVWGLVFAVIRLITSWPDPSLAEPLT